jgi:hypothetical protein
MPVVTPDDVLAAFKARWDDDLALIAAVPGGLWHQRPESEAAYPFARMAITEGDPEEFSGLTYLGKFTVLVSVYTNSTPSDTGSIRGLIEAAFRRTEGLVVPNATRVIQVKPVPGALEVDPRLREAGNVLVCTAAFEVWVQANRG